MTARLFLFLAFLAASEGSRAQSLGEAAARERAKRARSGADQPVPSFTNADLASEKERQKQEQEGSDAGTEASPDDSEAPRAGRERRQGENEPEAGVPSFDDASDDQGTGESGLDREQWSERAEGLQRRLRQAEEREAAARDRLEEIRARLNPMSPQYEQDVNRILQLQQGVAAAEAQADLARRALDSARQEIANFEEEARRAGVPPGWITPSP